MSKTTENYGLTKPEVGEFFSLETWNENMDKIDGELKKREDAQKESDNSLMNPKFTEAKERKNLTSGEKIHLMLGKISRFFSDMKAIAFSGSYNDLVDKPKIPTVLNNQTTTEEGYALDARQANPNIDGTLAKQVADLNGSLMNNLFYGQQVSNIKDIGSVGLYFITNASEMPSGNPFIVYSFGIAGRSRNYPIFAFDTYSDYMLYVGRNASNDGVNYAFSGWTQIQTKLS